MGETPTSSDRSDATLGPVRVWALAAGGMVGGGIYIALGVVIMASAQWAWLALAIAGLVAVASAYSYARLSTYYGKSGGAFEFLEEIDRSGLAGSLSWLLIIGYTLTISVYAYAFGHYVAHAFGGGPLAIRALAIGASVVLIGLNLLGLGKMTSVEVVIVTANLSILIILAAIGLAHWDPAQLSAGIEPRPPWRALVGAASIFIAYEGFQLLTYEYDEVRNAEKTFLPTLLSAAIFVVVCYVAVALGATMLAGAGTIIDEREVALSVAAGRAAGLPGMIAMTVAAAFATSAAINSTLFSSAKLAQRVARDGEAPVWVDHENRFGVPDRPVIAIGLIAAFLAVIGSLSSLVEASSLVFLTTFLTVNILCLKETPCRRWIPWTGIVLGAIIGIILIVRLALTAPIPLAILAALTLTVFLTRPAILKRVMTE